MNHLSLFSGIGGLDLAATRAGFTTAGFVEQDKFCQRVLAHHWPNIPIFDDVRNFPHEPFFGIDLLSGGFPCQDISAAGKGAGLTGERSGLWFAMLDAIIRVQPRYVVAENVAALFSRGIDTVLGGLEEAGYAAEAFLVGSDNVGAPHQRKRVFIVAERLADTKVRRIRRGRQSGQIATPCRQDLADPNSLGKHEQSGSQRKIGGRPSNRRQQMANADDAGFQVQRLVKPAESQCLAAQCGSGRRAESGVGRGAHGFPRRLDPNTGYTLWPSRPGQPQEDWEAPHLVAARAYPYRAQRLKALGNAVNPEQALPIMLAIAARIQSHDHL